MFIIETYPIAVFFCIITMLCWGSWANTQKLAQKSWRFELFYWDYVIGILLMSLLFSFTLGSTGEMGRGFVEDNSQAEMKNMVNALLGEQRVIAFDQPGPPIIISGRLALASCALSSPSSSRCGAGAAGAVPDRHRRWRRGWARRG